MTSAATAIETAWALRSPTDLLEADLIEVPLRDSQRFIALMDAEN